jgi:DNA-binding phage protein
MASKTKPAFDRYFKQRMENPEFAEAYREARAEIDATDTLVRVLDEARKRMGLSKADLARKIQAKPEILRRLFTMEGPNPTMSTVLKIAAALGYHLEFVPNAPIRSGRKVAERAEAARRSRAR